MGYRGRLESLAHAGSPGRIASDDGETFTFAPDQVRGGAVLKAGDEVDFILLNGQVRDLFVVPPPEARGASAPQTDAPSKTYYRPLPAEPVFVYYKRALTKRLFDYRGRARRKEYWSLLLGALITISLALWVDEFLANTINPGRLLFGWLPEDKDLDGVAEPAILYGLTLIVSLIHFMAIAPATVRRLHDAGHSSGALWIVLLPYVGIFFLLAQTLQDSHGGENEYGPSPKYRA
jgi:uncharacterized membrane protein YhaH (DUF805 family)